MSIAQDIAASVPEERVAALKADPYTFEAQTEAEMTLAMRSPAYRISHLYKILIKGDGEDDSDPGLVATFVPNRAQRRLIASFWHRNIILKARQLGMCLDPSTRVLTADLRWVPIGDIQPGQEVVSVDEHPPGGRGKARKMRTATVEHAGRVMRHAYRVSLSDGRQVVCTDRHPWLTRKAATDAKWRSLSGEGNQVVGKITVGTKVRSITTPWGEPDYQDGWFGGMLDGEGSISNGNRAGCQLSVSQVVGPVWARAHRYLDERGYAYRIEEDEGLRESKHGSEAVPRLALTRMDDIFRLIGTTRPSRFIGRRFWEGRELPGKRGAGVAWVEVTGIEYIGEQEMVDLQTSTGTYIAEGLVSHNTTFIAIMFLDACLFRSNVRAGMIAQTDPIAKKLFRDKVKFAYDNLPDHVRRAMPLERESADELLFAHTGSSIQVSTSMRSGTLQYLHVSEFGKICADFPKRAQEVVTGSIPTVPANGVIFIESTAEGREGHFYNMTMRAKALQEQGAPLTRKDYKLHFFPWFEEPNYRAPAGTVLVTKRDHDYFDGLEAKLGVVIDDEQRSWYCATRDGDFSGDEEMMFQEYPSCITGDAWVSTPSGPVRMRDVEPDGEVITAKFDQGEKPTYRITTRLGYQLTCTDDHPILTPSGSFATLDDGLSLGDAICLASPLFGHQVQRVAFRTYGFVDATITIDADLAEFLGLFMGDGSFHNGSVSIACDAGDEEVIARARHYMERYLGGHGERLTGSKRGCVEVRKASAGLQEPFAQLGIIEQRTGGGWKRCVHVPDFIMRSPKAVVAAFLRGLFEADGFVARKGNNIRLFAKDVQVCRDVQLLLLAFGIDCRVSTITKTAGSGRAYQGSELSIRKAGVAVFAREIGFISHRKQARARLALESSGKGRRVKPFDFIDAIATIEPAGEQAVYDITTATQRFIANGVVVHNCPEEAFHQSTRGTYYAQQFTNARKQGRILPRLPLEPGVPCYTCWDIGNSDGTAIWVVQKIGNEWRLVDFYEAWGEPYSHAVQWLQARGLVWDTHYLPHDADHIRQGQNVNKSPKQMLEELMPGANFVTVPRIEDVNWGIQQTRDMFPLLWFDEEKTKDGIEHLELYRRKWNTQQGAWGNLPDKTGGHSEAADALRQLAQAYAAGLINVNSAQRLKRRGSWRTV